MRSSRLDPDPLDSGFRGFAHRGLHGPRIPENSFAAFRAALDFGAGIECDVRLSGDGQVMVVHDHDLQRLCGSPLVVEDTPAEALAAQKLHATDEVIPWLSELLDLVVGRVPILIELKTCEGNTVRLAEAVANELADYAGPVGVMSFDAKVSWWLARKVPYLRRGLVMSAKARSFDRWTATGYASPHFLAIETTLLGSRWAAKMRRRKQLYTWTVRTPEQRSQAEVHADAPIWEADGRP